jgi:penicillin-binding protein A
MMLERRAWWIGNLILFFLLLLSLRIVYWQMLRQDVLDPQGLDPVALALEAAGRDPESGLEELKGETPGEAPPPSLPFTQRAIAILDQVTRGTIYARNTGILAQDQLLEDGTRTRIYTDPSFANVVGYVSGIRVGVAGLEAGFNNTLLGLDRLDAQIGEIIHQPIIGSDLILTLDPDLQHEAEELLAGKAGAVVVLDKSGEVLAMVSTPHYDPTQVLNQDYVNSLLDCSSPSCRAPFLNRAAQALYPPGSTWKTVALIAALDTGQVTPQTVFDFGELVQTPNGSYYVYEVDGGIIPDPNHRENRLDLVMSYAKSANAAFARIGDEMPAQTLLDYAARMGFGPEGARRFPFEIETSTSQVAKNPSSLTNNNLLRAATAIGQGELLVSPLDMARVVLAVINNGRIPMPYLVESIRLPAGGSIRGPVRGKIARGVMSLETARTVKELMVTVVESGSGGGAGVPGLIVGGKTGTAQLGGADAPHAWFIGFAEKGNNSVAIAVIVENGGSGAQVAAPIFARLANLALNE